MVGPTLRKRAVTILLLGKNGQLGFELQRALAPLGPLVALDRNEGNLAKPEVLRALMAQYQPSVVVNAAAYTAVDQAEAEPELAFAINAEAPAVLAEEAAKSGALLVHYSTDYVFDGSKAAAYEETDACAPLNCYGESKRAGELAILDTLPRHLIFRTSWVVGGHGGNFAKTMLRLAAQRETLNVVADQWGAPTSAALLADISALLIREAVKAPQEFAYGLYHLTNSGRTNWYEYARYVIEWARARGMPLQLKADGLQPIPGADYPTPARRPGNSCLSTRKLQQSFGLQLPDWRVSLDLILQQLLESR